MPDRTIHPRDAEDASYGPGLRADVRRGAGFLRSLVDVRAWLHLLRLLHFYNYSHVRPRRRMRIGPRARLSPTVSLRAGERIEIGARTHVGEGCRLWAGARAKIVIGSDCLLAPEVFLTVVNYGMAGGALIGEQDWTEADVVVGDGVWLGHGVIVLPGVTIGDGAVVGAGSVVTRSLPDGSIAVGVPARVVRRRVEI